MATRHVGGSRINTAATLKNGLLKFGISVSGNYRTWDWKADVERLAPPRSYQGFKRFTGRKGYVNKDSGSVRNLYGVKHRGRIRVVINMTQRVTGIKTRIVHYVR